MPPASSYLSLPRQREIRRDTNVFLKMMRMVSAGMVLLGVVGQGMVVAPLLGAAAVPSSSVSHWAFQPPQKVTLPPTVEPVRSVASANAIDYFIRSKLEEINIRSVPIADKTALLRRVTYDLTGLPPTPEELRAFLSDRSASAYERVVDRLLASQGFGERWAQHWLDLAHYADSNGFELDADRPDSWRYRDWVIRAINDDMPYTRFMGLQIAGDEYENGSTDALVASGFARCGPFEVVSGNIDPEVRRQNELTGATSTVGAVFLGLTMGCARCHDHKFDPISAADYYRLEAFFAGAQHTEIPIHAPAEKARFEAEAKRIKALVAPIEAEKNRLEEPYRKRLQQAKEAALTAKERAIRAKAKEDRTPEEARLFEGISVALRVTWEEVAEAVSHHPGDHTTREALKRRIHELQIQVPEPPAHAMAMTEVSTNVPSTWVLRRGDVKSKREEVTPRPPDILLASMKESDWSTPAAAPLDAKRSGRRLRLAQWLSDGRNPLTARVIVNRLWMHHFGRGLVATPSDFGTRGARPSHPELLDWLALELIRNGWHLKPMHRLMVLSQTYQLSSGELSASGVKQDPENTLYWRMDRRRKEAEGLRDSVLTVAGRLNRKVGGPGVRIPLEPEVRDLIFTEAEVVDLWPVTPAISEHDRRSIYLHRKRNVHYPMFDAFDAPDMLTSCPQRGVSLHAPQALVMMNSEFAQSAARSFAQLLIQTSGEDTRRIEVAFERCFSRRPSARELRLTRAFLREATGTELERWTDLALALINSNEFTYVP